MEAQPEDLRRWSRWRPGAEKQVDRRSPPLADAGARRRESLAAAVEGGGSGGGEWRWRGDFRFLSEPRTARGAR